VTVNRDILAIVRESHVAGWLLQLIGDSTGNLRCLGDMLATIGLALGHRQVEEAVDRLEAAGLVTTVEFEAAPGQVRTATLTRDGREVLDRRERHDGITLPD
jgi:DNA-binding transcriptional ArsR family regulator